MHHLSDSIREALQNAASINDRSHLQRIITDTIRQSGRKDRKDVIHGINTIIIKGAIESNNPDFLNLIQGVSQDDATAFFAPIIQHYIRTGDETWLTTILNITQGLEKKRDQSQILAILAQMLVRAGIATSNPVFINHGLEALDRISFRKYRSEIIIDIIPFVTNWAIATRDLDFLSTTSSLVQEIGDISKRSAAHAGLAHAIATIAISEKDLPKFIGSLHIASTIKQKTRRQTCISSMIENAVTTSFCKTLDNIPGFIGHFDTLPEEIRLEIIGALLEQLFDYTKDRKQISIMLSILAEKLPFAKETIIHNLLKKAEKDGEVWYLSTAIRYHDRFFSGSAYPVREIVKAAISVAEHSGDMTAVKKIVPAIERSCNGSVASRIYLQLTQVMLARGNFEDALDMFARIGEGSGNRPSFDECSTAIFIKSIMQDKVSLVEDRLFKRPDTGLYLSSLHRAIFEICKHFPDQDIIRHIDSLNSLMIRYPQKNQLVSESISILINRGFLDSAEPSILITLTESISDPSIKERTLSHIIIQVAKIGVKNKNRDYLQRAVGLTCLIEEEKTRSTTLTIIIDEATGLAVLDGDLDLLRRMREWSASLLPRDVEIFAMANIIDGMITCATDRRHPNALEEAYLIAQDIHDPSLQKVLIERIYECLVKTGCQELQDRPPSALPDDFVAAFHPFVRGLELLTCHTKKEERSLKVANVIDIILEHAQRKSNPDFIIPLAVYALEIENTDARDAMVSRIVANTGAATDRADSTDPYEIMASLLQRIEHVRNDPALLDLVLRMAGQNRDPFRRLSGLFDLAGSYIRLDRRKKAEEILNKIQLSVEHVPALFQKVSLLADLTYHYAQLSGDMARECLSEALRLLPFVESDRESLARKQVVLAIVRLYETTPDTTLIDAALDVVSSVIDPVEYVNAMISMYGMVRDDVTVRRDIITRVLQKCDTIPSPAQKASMLLKIMPLIMNDDDDEIAGKLLRYVSLVTRSIGIPTIADTIRARIANGYTMLWDKNHEEKIREKAIKIGNEIEHEEIRINVLNRIGQDTVMIAPLYAKIKGMSERMISGGYSSGKIAVLEKSIRSVHDRGKRAQWFCTIAILFYTHGKKMIAKRLLYAAIQEAIVIRPLFRRAYVLCDIATMLYSAGCEERANDILDMAVDTATNIRQFSDRDEVFDNLAFAMRFIREMEH